MRSLVVIVALLLAVFSADAFKRSTAANLKLENAGNYP